MTPRPAAPPPVPRTAPPRRVEPPLEPDQAERNRRAAEADELYTEGRRRRKPPAPVNYSET